MSVSFGAQTGLVLVDARPQAGRCYLPLSVTLLGRNVTIKDQFGVAAVSSIQVLTNSPDTFEDGTTSRWITHGYGFMTIAATASNVWTVVGGTRQPSFQASTISTFILNTQSISSITSAVSQEAVSTLSVGTAYIGILSTANLAAPSPLFSTAQLLDTGTGTYTSVSLSSSFIYINNTAAPTIVIPTQLVSTVAGLGTTTYISTLSLNSTIAGLGAAGYISTFSLTSSIVSTTAGLGTASYVSSPSLTSSLVGLGSASYISSLSLTSSIAGLGDAGFISSATLLSTTAGLTSNISTLIDPIELTSTIVGMGATGFISTMGLTSTVQGLGTVGFISSATLVSTVFGLRAETSTVAATAFTGSTVSLSAATIFVSSLKTSVLNASTAIVAWNGSAAPTNYGLAVDTLTLQTTNAGYAGGIASMAFATRTAAYPLARIYAVDSATSGSAVSQLVFQTAPINSTTFNSAFVYTGSLQTFTVPAGVTSVNIQIWGAGGGGGMGTSTVGGAGAYITGLLAVTPGQVLSLIVGGPGTYSTPTVKPFGGGGGGSANGNVAAGGGRSAIQFSPAGITLTAATSSGTAITYTTSGSYGIPNGSFVTVTGFTSTSFNISGAISVISGTQFSILSSLAAATATGTGLVYQELINAAGGGGGGGVAGNQSAGGYGGILTGGAGVIIAGTAGAAGGATQTAGGAGGVGSGDTGATGLFFMGASGVNGAGGGGGLYGGGAGGGISGGYGAAGGGGSSYISNSAFTYSATSAQSTGQAAPFTGTGYISGVAAGGNYASSGGGGLIVITNPPGGSMSEAMRIGTTGNVGIGTAAPATLLDVAGTTRSQTLSSLTMNASTITLNTGKLSTLNVVGSLDMSNTPINNITNSSFSPIYFGNPNEAAGGTYTTYVSSGVVMAVHVFKTVGTTLFTPTQNITGAQLLVIGGGGSGGGGYVGGGGGAGGAVYQTNLTITSSGAPYSILVGGGGVLAVNNTSFTPGVAGSNSSAFGYTGIGGGGGAGDSGSPPGGCGGGGGQMNLTAGGTGSQGFNGGTGNTPYGGGGGGMGSAGSNYNSIFPSQGGAGVIYSITGSNGFYAAGGGGGVESTALGPFSGGSVSGTVIGGNGANINIIATSGLPNTGSGGGGNGKYGGALGQLPGTGGSGIVVLAYPTNQYSSYPVNVGSITGDANSNLSLQATYKLSITGNTQIAGALQTSTSATAFQTLSTLNINDRTTPSTGALYQISSVLYYNSTVIGGVTAATIQAFTF